MLMSPRHRKLTGYLQILKEHNIKSARVHALLEVAAILNNTNNLQIYYSSLGPIWDISCKNPQDGRSPALLENLGRE